MVHYEPETRMNRCDECGARWHRDIQTEMAAHVCLGKPKLMVEVDALVPEGYEVMGFVKRGTGPVGARVLLLDAVLRPKRKRQFVVEETTDPTPQGGYVGRGTVYPTEGGMVNVRIVREIQPDEQILTMKQVPPSGPRPLTDE